jgi:hypothetical protein
MYSGDYETYYRQGAAARRRWAEDPESIPTIPHDPEAEAAWIDGWQSASPLNNAMRPDRVINRFAQRAKDRREVNRLLASLDGDE